MKLTASAASLANARAACQRALSYFYDGGAAKGSERQRDQTRKAIETELRLMLEAREVSPDCEDVAALIMTAPGIVKGFVQKTYSLNETFEVIGSSGKESPHGCSAFEDSFRVFLSTGTKSYEARNANLLTAVQETFKALDVELPEGLR